MEVISGSASTSLYWTGRYLLRSEIIGRKTLWQMDSIIDDTMKKKEDFFNKLDIILDYENAEEFLDEAVFGEHSSSIYHSLRTAKENAMMVRDLIHDDLFLYVNRAYLSLEKRKNGGITPFELEEILEHLLAFWGLLELPLVPSKSTHFISFGRYVERVDLMVRLFEDRGLIEYDLARLDVIGKNLSDHYAPMKPTIRLHSDPEILLESVNGLYERLFANEPAL